MRICDETNPSIQADFSVILSSASRRLFLIIMYNYMNNKNKKGVLLKSKMLSCHLTEQFHGRIF